MADAVGKRLRHVGLQHAQSVILTGVKSLPEVSGRNVLPSIENNIGGVKRNSCCANKHSDSNYLRCMGSFSLCLQIGPVHIKGGLTEFGDML